MGKEPDLYTATYSVHGASVGHTSLRAVTYLQDGRTVASHAKPIEVIEDLTRVVISYEIHETSLRQIS